MYIVTSILCKEETNHPEFAPSFLHLFPSFVVFSFTLPICLSVFRHLLSLKSPNIICTLKAPLHAAPSGRRKEIFALVASGHILSGSFSSLAHMSTPAGSGLTQRSVCCWRRVGVDFLASEGRLGLRSGERLTEGSLQTERLSLPGDHFQTCPRRGAWGKSGAEGGNLLRKEGKTIIFI